MTYQLIPEDGGAKATANLPAAVAFVGDEGNSVKDRIAVVGMISHYSLVVDVDVKAEPLLAALPQIASAIQASLLQPDDDGLEDYDSEGAQMIGHELASMCSTWSMMNAEFGNAAWAHAVQVLGSVSEVKCKKRTPMNNSGPQVVRTETIQYLMRTQPQYGQGTGVPPGCLDAYVKYVKKGHPNSADASQNVRTITQTNPTALDGKIGVVFDLLRAGNKDMANTLAANAMTAYPKDPKAFEDNLDLLLEMDFQSSCTILSQMSTGSPSSLVPHLEFFMAKAESGAVPYGMDVQVLSIFSNVAEKEPNAVFPFVDRLFAKFMASPNADTMLAQCLSRCGNATEPADAAVVVLEKLCGMLYDSGLSAYAPPVVLSGVVNMTALIGDERTDLLAPHIAKIQEHEHSAAQIVEKIVDWFEGRSLKKVDERLAALEAKVAAMNDEFSKQCANFDEVNALMDSKIADLKDFVGEVVQKLPQPVQLVMVGGVKKTLQLHFRCARTGVTVTTETKVWHQWCKVGFGLIKLGKCAAVAAAGNPMALVDGVGAVKDIYNGYKSKDDSDFNTFIKQPFLTSAERDRLIEQLRAAKFFEKMEYDSQLGDWVLLSSLDADEYKAAMDKQAADKAATAANQKTVKGKNLGLGSAKDIAAGAAEAMSIADPEGKLQAGLQGQATQAGVDLINQAGLGGALEQAQAAAASEQGQVAAASYAAAGSPAPSLPRPPGNTAAPPPAPAPAPARARRGWFGSPRKATVDQVAQLEARVAQLEQQVAFLLSRAE